MISWFFSFDDISKINKTVPKLPAFKIVVLVNAWKPFRLQAHPIDLKLLS